MVFLSLSIVFDGFSWYSLTSPARRLFQRASWLRLVKADFQKRWFLRAPDFLEPPKPVFLEPPETDLVDPPELFFVFTILEGSFDNID